MEARGVKTDPLHQRNFYRHWDYSSCQTAVECTDERYRLVVGIHQRHLKHTYTHTHSLAHCHLLRLHEADEAAVDWLTTYGS